MAKLYKKGDIKIYKTLANDISESDLYPSQTWASFNTGVSYQKHNCYWYSDYLNPDNIIWNKLAQEKISIGVVGSLHSSKFPKDLKLNPNYKFYLPDCFQIRYLLYPNHLNLFKNLIPHWFLSLHE